MKQKIALKDKKKLRKQMSGKFNNIGSADENKYKNITVEPLFKDYKRQDAEILGLLHPGQASLGYFLAWLQSPAVLSTV
jgi:hypothetical protein